MARKKVAYNPRNLSEVAAMLAEHPSWAIDVWNSKGKMLLHKKGKKAPNSRPLPSGEAGIKDLLQQLQDKHGALTLKIFNWNGGQCRQGPLPENLRELSIAADGSLNGPVNGPATPPQKESNMEEEDFNAGAASAEPVSPEPASADLVLSRQFSDSTITTLLQAISNNAAAQALVLDMHTQRGNLARRVGEQEKEIARLKDEVSAFKVKQQIEEGLAEKTDQLNGLIAQNSQTDLMEKAERLLGLPAVTAVATALTNKLLNNNGGNASAETNDNPVLAELAEIVNSMPGAVQQDFLLVAKASQQNMDWLQDLAAKIKGPAMQAHTG